MDNRGYGKSLSRRTLLRAAAGAAAAVPALTALPGVGMAQTRKVRLSLPWLPDATYSYAYVARNQGYWRRRGLDVDIARGNGSLTVGQAVAAGQFDVGIIAVHALFLLAARGVELVSIGNIDYDPTMGVAVLDDSPIRKPKDLEGKTIGQTMTSGDAAFFPIFCEKANVDIKKITVVNLDANVRTRTLWEKKVDAITGNASSMLPASASAGYKTRYMLYTDYGIDLYADTVVVRPEFLAENQALCEATVAGLMEGVVFQLTKPEDSLKIYLQEVKEMAMSAGAEAFARLGTSIFLFSVLREPGVQAHGLGWYDIKKLNRMLDLIMKYQVPPNTKRPDPGKIFRNLVAGRYTLTPGQWAAAKDYTKDLTGLLRPA